jgi:hypothetical protein
MSLVCDTKLLSVARIKVIILAKSTSGNKHRNNKGNQEEA